MLQRCCVRYVYLHGFASGPKSSKAQALQSRFSDAGLSLEVPDLNLPDFERMTITAQLEHVDGSLHGQKCDLIGSSMGGYLAALYASLHPEQVQRVVLLAPAFEFFERWPLLLGEEAFAAWQQNGYRDVYHYGNAYPARIGWQLIEDARSYPSAPAFSQPGLILHGDQDDTVPVELSRRYASGRTNIRLRELHSDHQLTNAVQTVWSETRDFLGI